MRKGVEGFSKERLRQALEARGMSQSELASRIKVSSGTVSKWFRGEQSPEPDAAQLAAKELGVQFSWLLRPVPTTKGSVPLYRSNASALLSARRQMGTRHDWSKELTNQLDEFVEFPAVDLPTIDFKDPTDISKQDIENAANACRVRWNLGFGPLPDAVLALENAGIVVIRENLGIDKIEGLSSWCHTSHRPFVYLSASKDNAFRSRFDVAHELGHLVLHRLISEDFADAHYKLMEQQAHSFAGAFLLPKEGFQADLPKAPSVDTLLGLKMRWKVSIAAMIKRLEALDLISPLAITNMWKLISSRGWRKREPFDDDVSPEEPRLMRRAVELLIDSNVMTAERVPEVLGPSARDLTLLLGLPENYFSSAKNMSGAPVRVRNNNSKNQRP